MENNPLEKKEISQEEVVSHLQDQIHQAKYDLEHVFLPQLGHSEAKRLLLAAMSYPMHDKAFDPKTDGEAMVKAYSACKAISDALVALGVEVVIHQMVENQKNFSEGGGNE